MGLSERSETSWYHSRLIPEVKRTLFFRTSGGGIRIPDAPGRPARLLASRLQVGQLRSQRNIVPDKSPVG